MDAQLKLVVHEEEEIIVGEIEILGETIFLKSKDVFVSKL